MLALGKLFDGESCTCGTKTASPFPQEATRRLLIDNYDYWPQQIIRNKILCMILQLEKYWHTSITCKYILATYNDKQIHQNKDY